MDYSILIAGAAGQCMDTIGNLLEKVLKRYGFHVFSYKDFMSRVRGGHNFVQIRFSDKPIYTHDSNVDLIFGLNEESISLEKSKLKEEGIIICDKGISNRKEVIGLPLMEASIKCSKSSTSYWYCHEN
ncbi:MAG TPA: 2-oxoacid:acceptor oxidoreductase family protein [Tissierellales bacterium]|nr:2-oxoacid:acceptor oxidoreductase family protein [Tissierellales bacterium]